MRTGVPYSVLVIDDSVQDIDAIEPWFRDEWRSTLEQYWKPDFAGIRSVDEIEDVRLLRPASFVRLKYPRYQATLAALVLAIQNGKSAVLEPVRRDVDVILLDHRLKVSDPARGVIVTGTSLLPAIRRYLPSVGVVLWSDSPPDATDFFMEREGVGEVRVIHKQLLWHKFDAPATRFVLFATLARLAWHHRLGAGGRERLYYQRCLQLVEQHIDEFEANTVPAYQDRGRRAPYAFFRSIGLEARDRIGGELPQANPQVIARKLQEESPELWERVRAAGQRDTEP